MSDMVELATVRALAERKRVSPRVIAAVLSKGYGVAEIEALPVHQIHDIAHGVAQPLATWKYD